MWVGDSLCCEGDGGGRGKQKIGWRGQPGGNRAMRMTYLSFEVTIHNQVPGCRWILGRSNDLVWSVGRCTPPYLWFSWTHPPQWFTCCLSANFLTLCCAVSWFTVCIQYIHTHHHHHQLHSRKLIQHQAVRHQRAANHKNDGSCVKLCPSSE